MKLHRNACTFDEHEDLLSFIDKMKRHSMFGGHPVRVKNMFLFDEERTEKQFHYRTVMINWLFSPNITYGELAEKAKGLWERYYNFQSVAGYGDKDPSESGGTLEKANTGGDGLLDESRNAGQASPLHCC